MTTKLLIIDDEDVFREDLASLLRRREFQCDTAPDGVKGLAAAKRLMPDIIFCDIRMPGKSGLELLDEIAQVCPQSKVIMLTAYGTLETAVDAFRKGVADYITKPVILEDILRKIKRVIAYERLIQENKLLRRELAREAENAMVVGKSEAMSAVMALIDRVAPTRSTVLILGESGTGKELIARAVHEHSLTRDFPFVPINCAGIPENLLESELFGHVRGAFTGAVSAREGFLQLAQEGTVLLDEIAEMPLTLQSKLLRVLEQREFSRLGSTAHIPFKARIIASTNKDLRELAQQGLFREDLFFRLAVFEIMLPPLRQRRADIPLLVNSFITTFNHELRRNCHGLDNESMRHIISYSWPGNVRELKNVIERAMILQQGDFITTADLPHHLTALAAPGEYADNLRQAMRAYEQEHIRRVIVACGGNKEEAARRLQVDPSTLYRKLGQNKSN